MIRETQQLAGEKKTLIQSDIKVECPFWATIISPSIPIRSQKKLLNLMLFYSGRDHTIIAAKDSSWLDVENRAKHNQFIMTGRRN